MTNKQKAGIAGAVVTAATAVVLLIPSQPKHFLSWDFDSNWRTPDGYMPQFVVFASSNVQDVPNHPIANLDGSARSYRIYRTNERMFYAVAVLNAGTGDLTFTQ